MSFYLEDKVERTKGEPAVPYSIPPAVKSDHVLNAIVELDTGVATLSDHRRSSNCSTMASDIR
jgi:hypothetical protein